ncbi:acyltransferase family protein [Granulicella arctica]|uniref:acyltransferase family protein n=1 Tax=Granulicella arctica TaxID=940613 RepID=UPI0021DFA755|nr:acyltransferase [Granulicella arctica]
MIPTTKRHFLALDGLRGVAALAVVTFHFMEMVIGNYSKLWIGHGWLAVDFFFCLSGFVIGYAYDNRLEQMGLWDFLKVRLIRLHPLVVFGSVLGLLTLLVDPFHLGALGYSAGRVVLIFVTSIFLIPYPVMQERGHSLFSLNSPAWSLFWEYVANLIYAIVLYRWSRRWLSVATVIAAIVLCSVGYAAGNLWAGFNGKTFWTGAARVSFSFLAGLLVHRSGWIIRTKLGFGALSVLLLLAFMMPYATGGWIREAAVIIVYFPLLVVLGAGATLGPRAEKLCRFAGDMSYPLYMTHYAVIWSFGEYYERLKPDAVHLTLVVVSGVLLLTAFAYLVMIFYDLPIRAFLRSRSVTSASRS